MITNFFVLLDLPESKKTCFCRNISLCDPHIEVMPKSQQKQFTLKLWLNFLREKSQFF